ncbi:hypothetical protein FACS1894217_15870 [Clostridia bacterium]|nr:hypothetical protein FACS1894217_15870 [Clostridia bacterium]
MEVILLSKAAKYLAGTNEPAKSRLIKALSKLEEEPPRGDIIPLKGEKNRFRLVVGGYRALFTYDEAGRILVTDIDVRGQIYKHGRAK